MRFYLAIYDPAYLQNDGSYWTWRHAELSPRILDRLYYRIAEKFEPESMTGLTPSDIHGGCCDLCENWLCIYRFLNGGRDTRGRPGRFIVLCAFVKHSDAICGDPAVVLDCALFHSLATSAPRSCPLLPPAFLTLDIEAPRVEIEPLHLNIPELRSIIEITGHDAIRRAILLCARPTEQLRLQCMFSRKDGIEKASVSVNRPALAKASPSLAKDPGVEKIKDKATGSGATSLVMTDQLERVTTGHREHSRSLILLFTSVILIGVSYIAFRAWTPKVQTRVSDTASNGPKTANEGKILNANGGTMTGAGRRRNERLDKRKDQGFASAPLGAPSTQPQVRLSAELTPFALEIDGSGASVIRIKLSHDVNSDVALLLRRKGCEDRTIKAMQGKGLLIESIPITNDLVAPGGQLAKIAGPTPLDEVKLLLNPPGKAQQSIPVRGRLTILPAKEVNEKEAKEKEVKSEVGIEADDNHS